MELVCLRSFYVTCLFNSWCCKIAVHIFRLLAVITHSAGAMRVSDVLMFMGIRSQIKPTYKKEFVLRKSISHFS